MVSTYVFKNKHDYNSYTIQNMVLKFTFTSWSKKTFSEHLTIAVRHTLHVMFMDLVQIML